MQLRAVHATTPAGALTLRPFYRASLQGKRVLLADDVRNTGETFARAAALARDAGATVLATAEIYDRMEAIDDLGVPNISLAEYKAPENYKVGECPLCKDRHAYHAFLKASTKSSPQRTRKHTEDTLEGSVRRATNRDLCCLCVLRGRAFWYEPQMPERAAFDVRSLHTHLPVLHRVPVRQKIVVVIRQQMA